MQDGTALLTIDRDLYVEGVINIEVESPFSGETVMVRVDEEAIQTIIAIFSNFLAK